MDVGEIFIKASCHEAGFPESLTLEGWLVVIEAGLFVLEKEYKQSYEESKKIRIQNADIVYAVRDKIQPLGGGGSFVFHECKISGVLCWGVEPTIEVGSIFVFEVPAGFRAVDISPQEIARCKKKYGNRYLIPSTIDSDDWLDHI